jgi:fructose-specific phosphotransferase system IIC component
VVGGWVGVGVVLVAGGLGGLVVGLGGGGVVAYADPRFQVPDDLVW